MQFVGCVIVGLLLSFIIESIFSIICGKNNSIRSNDFTQKFIISFITGLAVFCFVDFKDNTLYAGVLWGIIDGMINYWVSKKRIK